MDDCLPRATEYLLTKFRSLSRGTRFYQEELLAFVFLCYTFLKWYFHTGTQWIRIRLSALRRVFVQRVDYSTKLIHSA
jgi:hypothetical protein